VRAWLFGRIPHTAASLQVHPLRWAVGRKKLPVPVRFERTGNYAPGRRISEASAPPSTGEICEPACSKGGFDPIERL